jgi:uncharacterized protein YkwD
MASKGRLATPLPGEPSIGTRVRGYGYSATGAREAVAAAGTQLSVLRQPYLMASGPIRAAVLFMRGATSIGVAVHYDSARHRYWITVDVAHAAPSPQQQYASAVLSQLNAERRAHGLPALTMNSRLVASAHAHNLAMAAANTMSHQLPGELDFASRILRAGYNYRTAGENVGWNSLITQAGALYLETLMYNEVPPNDGHRRNILSTSYREIGVDIYFDNVHHKLWLTEDFGSQM